MRTCTRLTNPPKGRSCGGGGGGGVSIYIYIYIYTCLVDAFRTVCSTGSLKNSDSMFAGPLKRSHPSGVCHSHQLFPKDFPPQIRFATLSLHCVLYVAGMPSASYSKLIVREPYRRTLHGPLTSRSKGFLARPLLAKSPNSEPQIVEY